MFSFRAIFSSIFVSVVVLLLASCASVSVSKSEPADKRILLRKPDKIFIRPFEFEEAALRVDRSGVALARFKFDAQERFTRHLSKHLGRKVAPTEAIAAHAPLPKGNYWLIEGRFDRIAQGSRMARALIGLGLGGTKMETTAVIYDLSVRPPRPFLVVQTTGGSNASPGAIGTAGFFITGVTALTSLGNLLEGVRTGVSFDTVRTTKELSAALSEYLYKQRLISYDEAEAPKRLGHWQPDFWPFRRKPEPLPQGSLTVTPAKPNPNKS